MCTDKCSDFITPKKFLCWSLQLGSFVVGLVMTVIMVIEVICTSIQVYEASKYENSTSSFTYTNNYSYSVLAVIYSLFLLGLCFWFLWGVKKMKSTVVLSWLVIATVWLAQTFCLLLVLIYLHSVNTNFIGWLLSLIFGLLAVGVLAYGLLVVFGYWKELKQKKQDQAS